MTAFVLDNFIDFGRNYTAHTPEVGSSPLASTGSNGSAAVITAATNRVRGAGTGDNVFYYPDAQATDCVVEAEFHCVSNSDQVGLVLRLDPAANTYYRWKYIGQLGQFAFATVVNGTPIDSVPVYNVTLTPGQSYRIKFSVIGNVITGYIDGVAHLGIVESTIALGYAGLYFNSNNAGDTTGTHVETFAAYGTITQPQVQQIQVPATSGKTLYLADKSLAGLWFNISTGQYEAYNLAHWGNYVISLTEPVANSGVYFGTVPANLPAGTSLLPAYVQSGGSPAATDTQWPSAGCPLIYVLDWSGSIINSIAPLKGQVQIQLPAQQNSLAKAQAILDKLYDARLTSATSGVISVGTDGQATTWASPGQLDTAIQFWQKQVALLSGQRRRVRPIRLDRL